MISRSINFYCVFLLAVVVFPLLSWADKPVFRFVKSIGDDRDNYMFARITGLAISDRKEIFVSDIKFMELRKYGWDGKFIAKVDKRGRGPGGFFTYSGMQWFDDKLLVYDLLNRRIAITDANMKRFSYIKLAQLSRKMGGAFAIRNTPIALDSHRILAVNSNYDETGRLFFFDKNQTVLKSFFCWLPKDIADKKEKKCFSIFTHPNVAVNHQKKQILATFDYPDRDIDFYLYDFSGQLIRHFSYSQEKEYRFSIDQLDSYSNRPARQTMIWDVFPYKNYYMVFLVNKIDWDKPFDKWKSKFYFLFFRETGEMIHKMEWPVRFITITPDGYLAGVKEIDGEDKVMIYKFDPNALETEAGK